MLLRSSLERRAFRGSLMLERAERAEGTSMGDWEPEEETDDSEDSEGSILQREVVYSLE